MQILVKNSIEAKKIDSQHRDWPDNSIVLFAKDEDKILGNLVIVNPPHIEGLEVFKEHRNGFVFSRLFKTAENILKSLNREYALSFISDKAVEDYAKRLGYEKVNVTVWAKRIN